MTRLTVSDIQGIPEGWDDYDQRIRRILGVDLSELGAMAVGRDPKQVRTALKGCRLAAVSLSGGEGVLSGFAVSTADIGRRLGLEAAVMSRPDEEGFAEAADWGADFLIYADDDRYLVKKSVNGEFADNNPATSRAFVAALELMHGAPLRNNEVLVLGLGIIGLGAARYLLEKGAVPYLYDVDSSKRRAALAELGGGKPVDGLADVARALGRTNLIFDATNVRMALDESLWPDNAVVAAPGVPLSWPVRWLEGASPQSCGTIRSSPARLPCWPP